MNSATSPLRALIEFLRVALLAHCDGRAHIHFLEMLFTDDVARHRTVYLATSAMRRLSLTHSIIGVIAPCA